jgi:hypothetical protein
MAKKKQKSKKKQQESFWETSFMSDVSSETWMNILAIVLFVSSLLLILSLFNLAGDFGFLMKEIFASLFGWLVYILPIIMFVLGYLFINSEEVEIPKISYWGFLLFILSLSGFFKCFFTF